MKSQYIAAIAFAMLPQAQAFAESHARVGQQQNGARSEAAGQFTPVPGEKKNGYAQVGGKTLSNIVFEATSANALIRIQSATSKTGMIVPGYFDSSGVPCVHSVEPKSDGKKTCRPLDPNNPIERLSIEELVKWIGARADKDKSPFKEFLAWHGNGFPPTSADTPKAKLGETPAEKTAFEAYNKYVSEYREKLAAATPEQLKATMDKLQSALKIEDPKKRTDTLESILSLLFKEGMEAPGVEEGTKGWREITGGTLSPEQTKVAAAHYSAVQVEARKALIDEVSNAIRKQSPQIASVIDRVKNGAAKKSYDLLLSDSFQEADPQCATCGGMPNQGEFDDTIDEAIELALSAPTQNGPNTGRNIAAAGMQPAAAAVAEMAPEKPVFRLGTCFFCIKASPDAYAPRAQAVRDWIKRTYPGATIDEYDAAAAGEINKGEIKILSGGKQLLHTGIRSEAEVEGIKASVLQRLRPFKK